MIGCLASQQFRGGKAIRRDRNDCCRPGFLRRDGSIEVSQVGHTALVEQDIRYGDVPVDNAALVYVSKCPAQLPSCAEEVRKSFLRIPGLKVLAVLTESPPGKVLK